MYELKLTENIIKGDDWAGRNFIVCKSGIDYTNATIKCHVRRTPNGPLIFEKVVTPNSAGSGEINFDLELTAEETNLMQGTTMTDIQITSTGDGIKTPIFIKFITTNDFTKN